MDIDRLGWRARIGVVVPAFNTTMQPELEAMRPQGVTNHVARIMMPDGDLKSDADQEAVVRSLGADLLPSLRRVALVQPRAIVMGISIPTFWNGIAGMRAMKAELEAEAGVPVVLGAEACLAALDAVNRGRRLGIITPYQSIGDRKVRAFFEEAGYRVPAIQSVLAPKGSSIARTPIELICTTLDTVAAAEVDVVLQVGTNLAFSDLIESESARLGKPVLAINAACYWTALRLAGVADKIPGYGPPLDR